MLAACKATLKDVTYFQDLKVNAPVRIDSVKDITFQPDDQLSIIVSCKEPELAALFNLVRAQNRLGTSGKGSSSMNSSGVPMGTWKISARAASATVDRRSVRSR